MTSQPEPQLLRLPPPCPALPCAALCSAALRRAALPCCVLCRAVPLQVPPLAADVDSLVAASELLSRRHTVLQNAMQALQDAGADVSTVTPHMDAVAAGMAETGALLATLVAGAGTCEAHRERQAGQHDPQAQLQEVQRLAQAWGALFPPAQQNPAAAAAATGK